MELREELLRGIYAYGFEKPSAIQQVRKTDHFVQKPHNPKKIREYSIVECSLCCSGTYFGGLVFGAANRVEQPTFGDSGKAILFGTTAPGSRLWPCKPI